MIETAQPGRDAPAASRDWPEHSLAADSLALFAGFFLLALGAIAVARQPGTVAVVWIANGAATAFIVSAPRERAWRLLGVVALSNLAANLAWGDTLLISLAFLPANTFEIALGVVLVRGIAARFADDHLSFLRVLWRGAALPPLLGATLGSLALHLLDFGSFERVWLDWYVGSMLGSVVALSLGLALRGRGTADGLAQLLQPRALLALAATVALAAGAFGALPYPFVWTGMGLMLLAFLMPRLVTFAGAFAVVRWPSKLRWALSCRRCSAGRGTTPCFT